MKKSVKNTEKNRKVVFVGISGGVDSAVSCALLQKQGYNVVGVFIRTWHPEYFPCNEEEERRDAMRVAAYLDIPFLTFDFEDVYKKEVADYMILEYKLGRTPNPDVMCNKEVKFGAFMKKALSMGADFVATGHYAIKKDGLEFFLEKGLDPSKDQSYFLWTLKQEQLSNILFPIGNLKKIEVRKIAKELNLPVAEKKDSQGICFLGAIDLKDFLKVYIKEKKGEVILIPSENEGHKEKKVIGWHDGVVFYTLGERHGFTITKKNPDDGPYYVVAKDIKKNILIVSQDKKILEKSTDIFLLKNSSCSRQSRSQVSFQEPFCLSLVDSNWIYQIPESDKIYTAQIRYHGEFLKCKINAEDSEGNRRVKVIFEKPILVASGQSCVIYDKDVCLGGGIVI